MGREVHTKLQSENLKGKVKLGDTEVDGVIILKWVLWKWAGFTRLMIGSNGGFL
jgi:hypothetical protein